MGALGAILGASWAVLGRRKAENAQMPKSFKNLRKINEFGFFGLPGGPLGGLLGRLGGLLGASWAVLGRRKAEKAQMPKSFKHLRKINDFGLFGPSWRTSWRLLGPSWRPLGSLLGRFEPSECREEANAKILEKHKENHCFWHLRVLLEDLLEASWAVLEASWGPLGPSWAILRPS